MLMTKWNVSASSAPGREIARADRVLFMVDGTTTGAVDPAEIWPDFIRRLPASVPITVVRNKADNAGEALGISRSKWPLTYSPVGTYRRRRGGAT
ncbi:hypothetical protein MJ560_28160 [Klebsiella pneumoniae]|nr:hypothetical protein MJ560_28160 [Klebsiella pneumoniae]